MKHTVLESFGKSTSMASSVVAFALLSPSVNNASEFMFLPQYSIQSNTTYGGGITTISALPSLSAQAIVSCLRDEGLPISAIAELAKVERKSVYSWLNGGAIRQENQSRLEILYDVLFKDKRASLLYLYRYWDKDVGNGITLRILFSEKKINSNALRQVLSKLWPLAEKYQMELNQSYLEANKDKGQLEAINDWQEAMSDGSDDW